jgi:hypothetical protein
MTTIIATTTPIQPEGSLYREAITTSINALGQVVPAKKPQWQYTWVEYTNATSSLTINNISTNPWATTTGIQQAQIPAANTLRMSGAVMEFNLALANANSAVGANPNNQTTLASTIFWFNRVDIVSDTNTILASLYPDVKMVYFMLKFNQGDIYSKFSEYNLNNTNSGFLSGPGQTFLPGNLPPMYYPLDETFITPFLQVWWSSSVVPLSFNMYPAPTIITNSLSGQSGAATVVTLQFMRVIIKTQNLIPRDVLLEQEDSVSFANQALYLNPTYVQLAFNQAMTPGAVTSVDLSGIEGRIAYLIVIIRTAGGEQVANYNWFNTIVHIGDRGLIDVVTSANQSLVTGNAPWLGKYMMAEINADNSDNFMINKCPGIYIIPLGGSTQAQQAGKPDGFIWQTSSDKNRLTIQPATATNQVDTWTKDNAAIVTGGFFRFYLPWCNDLSGPIAGTATTTTIMTAFAAIPYNQANANSVALSAAFTTSAATITFTYTTPRTAGLPGTIQLVFDNIITATGQESGSKVFTTTQGISGFPTGTANYDINIYGMVFQQITYAGSVGRFSYEVVSAPWYDTTANAKKAIVNATVDTTGKGKLFSKQY